MIWVMIGRLNQEREHMLRREHLRRSASALVAVLALVAWASRPAAQAESIPEGFTRIFNGRNADGWHWSRTVHHGTTAVAKVEDGVLVLQPYPFGQGACC